MKYNIQQASDFANRIKELGFRVFLAKSGDYGIITDDKAERVMCFSFSGLENSLSGNYGPPSRESGTGWRLHQTPEQLVTTEDVRKALYAHPFDGCGHGWKHFTTLQQHLAMYGSSSQYREL